MNRLFLLLFGAVTVVTNAQVPDYVPTEGLVAWYPFNGNANDESGNGNDGWNQGAIPTTDRFDESDHAFAFNISNNVELPSSSIADSFSLSIWFEAFEPSGEYVLDTRINNETGFAFLLNDSETIQFGFTAQGQYGDIIELQGLTVGNSSWHHAVFTFDNDTLKAILDNELIYSGAQSQDTFSSGGTIKLGVRHDYSGHWLDGKIDDIGIWNTALTEEEITALYNAEPPAPGCTDSTACNYDAEATSDDGSCIPAGCMEPLACNYNTLAECAGEACDYTCCPGPGCCGPGMHWDYDAAQCAIDESCEDDLDGDGVIGVNDLMQLLSSFGTDCIPDGQPEASEFTCGDPLSYHGYDYATVQIGEQCWFAENLRTEHYTNGDAIPANLSDSEWSSTTSGAVAVYGEDAGCENYSPDGDACDPTWSLNEYGRLYNWYAVDDARGLCRTGWHVPTDGEWMTLEMELGMSASQANSTGWRGTDQGAQMKTTYGWYDGGNGTNSSGFSGLPGGYRSADGYFNYAVNYGYWWSSSPSGSSAWCRVLKYVNSNVYRSNYILRSGFSVRCLRDAE